MKLIITHLKLIILLKTFTGDGRGIGQAFTDQETAQEQPQQPLGHPGVQGQLGLRLERRRPRGGEEEHQEVDTQGQREEKVLLMKNQSMTSIFM